MTWEDVVFINCLLTYNFLFFKNITCTIQLNPYDNYDYFILLYMLHFSRLTQLSDHITRLQSQMQTEDFYLV